jgi:alpha-glucosidase
MFKKLLPYRKHLEDEIQREGLPMQRPLFLHYEDDPVAYQLQYQYMFGRDILVAPVLDAGVTQWRLYLPDDVWIHMFTQKEYSGPKWILVNSPIGSSPVFYRKHSQFKDLFVSILQGDNNKTEL